MKKILMVTGILIFSSTAFGFIGAKSKKTVKDTKFIKVLEQAFEKPMITGDLNLLSGKNFLYKSYAQKKTQEAKKNFLSHYLKLTDVNLIEINEGVLALRSRDAVKNNTPVFKDEVPEGTREQMVTLVISLPKVKDVKNIDKSLRSLYSKDGDMKLSPSSNKLIVTDWTSNVRRIVSIIDQL